MNQEKYSDAKSVEFTCLDCGKAVEFSLLDLNDPVKLKCACGREYAFTPELSDKIARFEKLLTAVSEAHDILGSACVGIKFREEEVTVPYRLLLTSLNTLLRLKIDGKELTFRFRINPNKLLSKDK